MRDIVRIVIVAAIATAGAISLSNARAGSRSSSSYSFTTEEIDAAGFRASSASYTNTASAIGEVSGSPAIQEMSSNYLAKNGYIGQLYNVQGLAVSASPLSVNEAAARRNYRRALARRWHTVAGS